MFTAGLTEPGRAFVSSKQTERPLVAAKRAPRTQRATEWTRPGALKATGLGEWTALWDRDTEVPLRMWGPSAVVANATRDAATAERAARAFLAAHLAVLSPGASADDYELVANQLSPDGTTRSIGFAQRAHGLRVLGGGIGFAFKHDRLALVSSTALPHVRVTVPTARLAPAKLRAAATGWLATAGRATAARASSNLAGAETRVILPTVRPRRPGGAPSIDYHVAEEVIVDGLAGGSWQVWVDGASAAPIARKSLVRYATGRVLMSVPDRRPGPPRSSRAASFADFTIDAAASRAALDGTVTWAGNANGAAVLRASGQFVKVTNAAGAALTENVSLAPDTDFVWSRAAEQDDAQLVAYAHANIAKEFARTRLNPELAWLDQQLQITVNSDEVQCNAQSDGDSLLFFRRTAGVCENTARLADVVYHEFGHSLHNQSVIPGIGAFESALSEGLGDTYSAALTGDPKLAPGFFLNDAPLRDLDPARDKRLGVDDNGEPHNDGEIIGEALYDLRVAYEAKFGAGPGFERFLGVMYAVMQRAADIPSAYAEVLLADDDDGDLTNGVPNQCEIDAAFGAHFLIDPLSSLLVSTPAIDGLRVSLTRRTPVQACAEKVTGATLTWQQRDGNEGGTVELSGAEVLAGDIPTQVNGTVVQYKVDVKLSSGATVTYPNNDVDAFYEAYIGDVEPIYCEGFESGLAGWTASAPIWAAGAPAGLGGDPDVAFSGSGVLGTDLDDDGLYDAESSVFIESPEIDLEGKSGVRLQLQRWLGVEDGFFDQARILVNGTEVWSNFASANDPQFAGREHVDREWRFTDIDLKAVPSVAQTGKAKIRFEITSDAGLEFGGWNVDDVCLVTFAGTGPGDDPADEGGGCCSTGGDPYGALALGAVTFGLVGLRRRRLRSR